MFDFDNPPVPPVIHSGQWSGIRNHRFHLGDDDLRVYVHEDGRIGLYAKGRRITVERLALAPGGDQITLRLSDSAVAAPTDPEHLDVTSPEGRTSGDA